MKPRIFIGSSAERLAVLEQVENFLQSIGDCHRWTGAFTANKSNLDSLIQQTRLSDFSVLIAMKDDILIKKGETKEVARDNMILEFGLFLGAAGIRKSFLLVEEGIDLPSDLDGITLHNFTQQAGKYNSLDEVCKTLIKTILDNNAGSELGLLPSTALAIGYFNGFLKKVCDDLHRNKAIFCGAQQTTITDFLFHVIVPKEMDANGVDDIILHYAASQQLSSASTGATGQRGYPFHFKALAGTGAGNMVYHIHDLPTTLNTIQECIKLLMPAEQVGHDLNRSFLEKRELDNFCNVLVFLVSKSTSTKNHVVIERN
jgi:Predicted nucleotide-binding protein containing TIR-like domain